jgi:integrase
MGGLKGGLQGSSLGAKMPKRAKELTPAQIKGLKHPGGDRPVKVAVGGVSGLLIQIQASGAKSWVLRTRYGPWTETRLRDGTIQRGRKKREIGLGAYPDVLPGEAREKAREMRAKLEAGVDPIAERKEVQAALMAAQSRHLTFAEAFERWAAEKTKEFSTDRYRKQWRRAVEQYALPEIGKIAVADVALHDVLRVLEPIWHEKTETASKLRAKIEGALGWATVKGYRSGDNPAAWRGNLKHVLAAPQKAKPTENYPSLQLDDAARWWQALQEREGMGAAALAFQAMTATRTGATRLATWREIDLERGLWTIQPGRQSSKIPRGGEARTVPLTPSMFSLLEGLPRLKGCDYVFWAPKGGALSDATLSKMMRTIHEADLADGGKGFVDVRSGEAAVPHGLRSTFRTWVAERTNFDGDMAEVALFHKVGSKVAQAYNRADMIEKRRRMMGAWGEFLAGAKAGNVVKMAGAR